MRISLLHMSDKNIPYYEAAAPAGVFLTHFVRSDILYRAMTQPGPGVAGETGLYMRRIMAGADAALITCSLLSGIAGPEVNSADRLLADLVAEEAAGLRVDVLFTTLVAEDAIRALFTRERTGADIRVVPVHEARDHFVAGDIDRHDALARAAIAASDADRIVLLQGPLAAAAPQDPRVIRGPEAALARLASLSAAPLPLRGHRA
ncbi:hypothetical protein HMH01_12365 [Halovulum dunhuangense]|uniref:Asp/Glu/hydantoin racemase n=1 Tax=Halovulum dunhuangense TaxID=1505036 RepID=A0A849L4W1_9RHOB|nr:hypothetical protein [Halovulum dunhuangense]NNU81230.1 hypothetical protein [Halovulum dunhuangense]